jgi:rod shape-determining protein MreD
MTVLVAIPILSFLVILQSAVVSRMPLLHGTPDLVLLALIAWAFQERVETAWHWSILGGIFMSIASAMPFGLFITGYLVTTALARFLRQRAWKLPLIGMLITTFFGTLITQGLSILGISLTGSLLPLIDSLNLVTLPSLLLNILLAVPVYVLISDLASWLYPKEIEA